MSVDIDRIKINLSWFFNEILFVYLSLFFFYLIKMFFTHNSIKTISTHICLPFISFFPLIYLTSDHYAGWLKEYSKKYLVEIHAEYENVGSSLNTVRLRKIPFALSLSKGSGCLAGGSTSSP
jgi:hypothetical protein